MKRIIIILLFTIAGSYAFAQNAASSDTTKKKNQKSAATDKNNGQVQQQQAVHITPGASGVKRSIGYKFSAMREDSDPGNGRFRYNSQAASSVTFIFADNKDISEEDQTNWYSTWDQATGAAGRGRVTVTDNSGKVITVFDFTGLFINRNGYWKLPVRYVSGSIPADGSLCYYVFERIAHDQAVGNGNQTNQANPSGQAAVAVVAAGTVAPPTTGNQVQAVQTTQTTQTSQAIQTGQTSQTTQTAQTGQTSQTTQTTQTAQTSQTAQTTQSAGPTQSSQAAQKQQTATIVTQPVQSSQKPQTTQPVQTAKTTQTTQATQTKPATQSTQSTQVTQTPTGTYWVGNSQGSPAKQNTATTQAGQSLYPGSQGVQNYSGTRRKWYSGIIEIGYGFGLGDYGQNNFKFNFINGFRIGRFSSLGLGIGYRQLFTGNKAEPFLPVTNKYIPVFIDFRTTFSSKTLTPYLAVGYGGIAPLNYEETSEQGLLFNASGGIWLNVSERFAVFAGIVYEMSKLEFHDALPGTDVTQKNSNSIGINLGISF
jgi:hypothetical protein